MNKLKAQFQGWGKEAGITLILAACVMVLYAYQGEADFFLDRFGHLDRVKENADFCSGAYRFLFTFLIFFIIPAATVKFVYKKSLKDYGWTLGDWKFGFYFVLLSFILLPVPLYFNAGTEDFLNAYPLWSRAGEDAGNTLLWMLLFLFYYIGWEFFFRGFMQFSMVGKIAPFYIIMMQTLPSTIIHIGKPEGETAAAIIGGIVFGAVALRTRSILYPLVVHWYVGALTEIFCAMHKG